MFLIRNKKILLIAGGIILLIVLIGSITTGADYIKTQKKELKSEIKELKADKIKLQDSLEDSESRFLELGPKEQALISKYKRERLKRLRAERELKEIKNLYFSRPYLDSLKNNIIYK